MCILLYNIIYYIGTLVHVYRARIESQIRPLFSRFVNNGINIQSHQGLRNSTAWLLWFVRKTFIARETVYARTAEGYKILDRISYTTWKTTSKSTRSRIDNLPTRKIFERIFSLVTVVIPTCIFYRAERLNAEKRNEKIASRRISRCRQRDPVGHSVCKNLSRETDARDRIIIIIVLLQKRLFCSHSNSRGVFTRVTNPSQVALYPLQGQWEFIIT